MMKRPLTNMIALLTFILAACRLANVPATPNVASTRLPAAATTKPITGTTELPAPPPTALQQPDIPFIAADTEPLAESCYVQVVGAAPIVVYAAPNFDARPVARLTGWLPWQETAGIWHAVTLSDNQPGWVAATEVAMAGSCGEMPVTIMPAAANPVPTPPAIIEVSNGLPYADQPCTLYRQGEQPDAIHAGPGENYPQIGRLVDWTLAVDLENGWYRVEIGPERSGWLDETGVSLRKPCDFMPDGSHIQFAPGTIAAAKGGLLGPAEARSFHFLAQAGQMTLLELLAGDPAVSVTLLAPDDSVLESDLRSFRLSLPADGQYTIALSGGQSRSSYSFLLQIEPLGAGPAPLLSNAGDVPAGQCAVTHPGGDLVIPVHREPNISGEVVGYLNNWATVSSGVKGWYRVNAFGQPGWIAQEIGLGSSSCPPA